MEYASFLINRGEVGHDGKTPYERCKDKRGKLIGLAFGEKILWRRRPVGGNLSKLTCLWEDGIFLGVKGSSGEYIVGDGSGVWKTRTLMMRPLEERWDKGALGLVGGVPWRVNDDDPKADGEAMKMDIPSEEASHRTGEGGDGPSSNPEELLHHERALDQVRLQPGLPWMQIVVEGDDAAS